MTKSENEKLIDIHSRCLNYCDISDCALMLRDAMELLEDSIPNDPKLDARRDALLARWNAKEG